MKQLILSTLAILLTASVFAQKEGSVLYQRVTQLKFEAPEGMEEMFKNMPKEQSAEKILIFKDKVSVYQNAENKIGTEDNVVSLGDDNMKFEIDFQEPDERLYIDLASGSSLHQKEFMSKQFLVKGEPTTYDWKLGKEKKKIAGYICMNATTTLSDTIPVTAWFTPQIPVNIGPDGYGGLPGLILQIEKADGDQKITATAIELSTNNSGLIMEPSKGKKISQEKYKAIVEEKMKELNATRTSGGATFIEIRQ